MKGKRIIFQWNAMAGQHLRSVATGYNEMRQHLILAIALSFCILVHVYLLTIYLVGKIWILALTNLVSLMVYIFCAIVFIKFRKYLVVETIIVLEVSAYVAVIAYTLGIDNYIIGNFLLIFVLQALLPYGPLWMRISLAVTSIGFTMLSLGFHYIGEPIMILPTSIQDVLLASNICIMCVGSFIEIRIDQFVEGVIHASHQRSLGELSLTANTDMLTSTYNRRYAEEYFKKMKDSGESTPYYVAMIDVDKFKEINDTYGHESGDQVLIYLGNFFREHLRRDDMVFRWGGDEFLIVLKSITTNQAYSIINKLRKALDEISINVNGQLIKLTISAGVAELDVQDPHGSIERCDRCLYKSKRHGRNVVFSEK